MTVTAWLALIVAGTQADDRAPNLRPPPNFTGVYAIVAGEKYGEPDPIDQYRGWIVEFTENTILAQDREGRHMFACAYRIEPGKPCRITMASTLPPRIGEIASGLIDKEGDTVRLIYALAGSARPSEFKTKEKQLMFTLKAVKE
jgi:hypothetical protein